MKRLIGSTLDFDLVEQNTIRVTMYLRPEIFVNSEVVIGSTYMDKESKYHTDVNPYRALTGPLSEYGQQLEPPIQREFDAFVEDCAWLVKEYGFTIIKRQRSTTSMKSEYIVVFGIDDTPCGSIIYDLRISDHPLDATFPEELKDEVLNYLKMDKVLDESATKVGINFWVEKITVGSVKNDTWDRAFNRLALKLKSMRNRIRDELNRRSN